MERALYTTYLGMRARQQMLDTRANNIANASTPGFKAELTRFQSVETLMSRDEIAARLVLTAGPETPPDISSVSGGLRGFSASVSATNVTNHTAGELRRTDRSLDVALQGDAFFVVSTPRGERYARAGNFTVSPAGQMIDQNGDMVICRDSAGADGPLTLPPGEYLIAEDGTVSVNQQSLGQLKLVRFADPGNALTKEGGTLFALTGKERPQAATDVRVIQGSLEMANGDPLLEMAALLKNMSEFESLQKSISLLMNDVGRKISNDIGRV
jgi:flagellar basal body rod protein FlgG